MEKAWGSWGSGNEATTDQEFSIVLPFIVDQTILATGEPVCVLLPEGKPETDGPNFTLLGQKNIRLQKHLQDCSLHISRNETPAVTDCIHWHTLAAPLDRREIQCSQATSEETSQFVSWASEKSLKPIKPKANIGISMESAWNHALMLAACCSLGERTLHLSLLRASRPGPVLCHPWCTLAALVCSHWSHWMPLEEFLVFDGFCSPLLTCFTFVSCFDHDWPLSSCLQWISW